ncbi:2-oxoglutarate dehydrogenase E1 component [Geothermobacter hydrogeniphilus]|uniref:oxoglutarate dehydrogenase (succinyl-transferring) n=1 Tax=Geothermobacter hydrogeniphilus TaxID=1969733 RepID=A0A1X0Y519_9BACT|nr:2-oxoglutarate dehydrogenase E1 component [Geothermobacter hydrogeniphilus]ORJ60236.1 2-oxoglutarate dehydrogenase E1 component [Geothermobacter hydrogeniphilus]
MTLNANASPEWLENQFRLWQEDPRAVPDDLRSFFSGFELARQTTSAELDAERALKQSAVDSLIYRYRDLGHLQACTDPLNPCPPPHPALALEAFDLGEEDLDTCFHPRRFLRQKATLREILDLLRETYCRNIGVEFMHIQDPDEREWLKERMESVRNRPQLDDEQKLSLLRKLQEASLFELFLHRKFVGQKRFSLEGGEVMIPLLECIAEHAADLQMKDIVLGMAHRGRLNVLANIFGKPLANMFAEFTDNIELAFVGEGDVKYHKGFSCDRRFPCGETVHLSIASNPSHLEAVNPVVEGKCRARHSNYGPGGRRKVLPILIHGDAAFAGQGMVPETLNLSQLDGYHTGGTLHIVLNNQIGFTTSPAHARSTLYATDVAKMLMVPIFHVHGEDPEAAAFVAELALDYRQCFGRDAVIEIICYRRQGHNEGDEPFFTQPLMYEKIRRRPPVHEVYAARLVSEGIDPQRIEQQAAQINLRLEEALKGEVVDQAPGYQGKWSNIQRDYTPADITTGTPVQTLQKLARRITTLPPAFTPHPKIARLLENRRKMVLDDSGLDWGAAEALAFATLLSEGVPIRLSGQDCRRGTFNHRHAVLVDSRNGQLYVPLAFLSSTQAPIQVYNSMLSENAVLGFEYGYSLEMPEGLTIWEAQFGDFANGAQVIIDQFISSSGSKWDRTSGLVMYLPHGYEGQGAEHSSARIERYLLLCADNNLQLVNPSTPAQLFHLLRRQMKVPWRRPLIIFSPKSLLRHPVCRSKLDDLSKARFCEVLTDDISASAVQTVLICSGKIYFELLEKKRADQREDVALVRIEQLYPLREEALRQAFDCYPRARAYAWVQEEPANGGAWSYIRPHLADLLGTDPVYVGRPAMAATAVGSHRQHNQEQKKLISLAFSL